MKHNSIVTIQKRVWKDSFSVFRGWRLGETWQEVTYQTTERILNENGFRLVECLTSQKNRNVFIRVIVFGPSGVTLNDCERLHKLLLPNLEVIIPEGLELSMELTSPGIDRIFKSNNEFRIFTGKEVLVYLKNSNHSLAGTIEYADDLKVQLRLKDGSLSELIHVDIQKAKLNY